MNILINIQDCLVLCSCKFQNGEVVENLLLEILSTISDHFDSKESVKTKLIFQLTWISFLLSFPALLNTSGKASVGNLVQF